MDNIKVELQKIYPEATVIDLHNMVQDLTELCIHCLKTTMENKEKAFVNENKKIPEKSS